MSDLIVTVSREPDLVQRYFDARGWEGESRSHAEVSQTYLPGRGWKVLPGRRRVSREWLLAARLDGITAVVLRVRYADRRVVIADFSVKELLTGITPPPGALS